MNTRLKAAAAVPILVAGLALTACGPKVTADYTSTVKPTIAWHYWNPLDSTVTGNPNWQTTWQSNVDNPIDRTKSMTVVGVGISLGGMKTTSLTASISWGDCWVNDNGWIWRGGGSELQKVASAVDSPPVTNGQADSGTQPIISFTAAQLTTIYNQKGPVCHVEVNGTSVASHYLATGIEFDAFATTLAGQTAEASLWSYWPDRQSG